MRLLGLERGLTCREQSGSGGRRSNACKECMRADGVDGSSAHVWRSRVVPSPPLATEPGPATTTPTATMAAMRLARRLDWAALLRRVFGDQVTQCPRCGDPLRVLAFITDPRITRPRCRHGAKTIDEPAAAARAGGSRHRLGQRHRQLHGLGLSVGKRIGLVGDRIAVATLEQPADLAHDARGNLLDVLVGGRRQCVKAERAIGAFVPHALGDQGMKMHVSVGERAHPLDCGDGASLAARDAAVTRAAAIIRRHDAHEHGHHLRDQRLVAEQADAQPPRERQRPLPVVGDHRKNVIHQVRRASRHPRAIAALLIVWQTIGCSFGLDAPAARPAPTFKPACSPDSVRPVLDVVGAAAVILLEIALLGSIVQTEGDIDNVLYGSLGMAAVGVGIYAYSADRGFEVTSRCKEATASWVADGRPNYRSPPAPPRVPLPADAPLVEAVETTNPVARQLTQQAHTAALRGDCAAAARSGERVKELDEKYYAGVFVTDPAIARCLED